MLKRFRCPWMMMHTVIPPLRVQVHKHVHVHVQANIPIQAKILLQANTCTSQYYTLYKPIRVQVCGKLPRAFYIPRFSKACIAL